VHIHVYGPSAEEAIDPPILILDGIGCSGWAFRQIIPKLARGRRVALMHHRGHGASPTPPRPWKLSMHTLADDAAAASAAAQLGPCLVVGFSMGFQVALEFYRRHRSQVCGLVSLAGPSGQPLDAFGGGGWAAQALPFVTGATRLAKGIYSRLWRDVLPSTLVREISMRTSVDAQRINVRDFEVYFRGMSKMHPDLFVSMLGQAQAHCADDLLASVAVPTLVVAGGRDTFIPSHSLRSLAYAVPNSRWQVFPTATHALPAEYPGEVFRALEELAAEIAERS
jgi:pimeloyl-ACP methyl ester carboxylesterase